MNRSKKFIIIFIIIITAFVMGRDFNNEETRKLRLENKGLESQLQKLVFQTEEWENLSPNQKYELSKGNVQLNPGSYVVGKEEGLLPGKYLIYNVGNQEGKIIINDTEYNICPDPTFGQENCTKDIDNIILNLDDKIVVEKATVRTTFSK